MNGHRSACCVCHKLQGKEGMIHICPICLEKRIDKELEKAAHTLVLLEAMPHEWSMQREHDKGWSIWDPTTDTWQAWDCATAEEAINKALGQKSTCQ